MPIQWSHPRFGTLHYDGVWWRREIKIASLQSFTYIDAAVRAYRSEPERFELVFQCEPEDEQPNAEMAAIASTVLDNELQLVPDMLDAIWSDLNGQGPKSGMWWHGDLANAHGGGNGDSAVHDSLDDQELPMPTCANDLSKVLEPKNLTIRSHPSLPGHWLAEFNFHAGFDVEHGVGVLTDGVKILGIGYSSDVSLFEL